MLLSLGLVSAQTYSCADDQTILKLASQTNSHGELYNGAGNYGTEICYNEIFGVDYTLTNPHACSGNGVLDLSTSSNAHGAQYASAYTLDICYGDLVCNVENVGSGTCSSGSEVLRMSALDNAHMAVAGTTSYNYAICCTSAFASGGSGPSCGASTTVCESGDDPSCPECISSGGTVDNAFWEGSPGSGVLTESYVNSTVRLVAETTGFATGTQVIFTITERDGGVTDDGDVNVVLSGNTDFSGNVEVSWFIDDNIMTAADSFNEYFDGKAEFFFEASIGSETEDSGQLNVFEIVNPNPEPPVPVIDPSKLAHKGIYFTGTTIEFGHLSTGQYDTTNWTVEDSNGNIELSRSEDDFNWIFNTPGQRTITLKLTDSSNPNILFGESQIGILVLPSNEEGIFAFIDKPSHHEFIPDRDFSGDGELDYIAEFSAADSYVVENLNSNCPVGLRCVAGTCPSSSENAPVSCSAGQISFVSNGGSPGQGFTNLHFEWAFDGVIKKSGFGNVSGTKSYTESSVNFNDKEISLTVNYSSSGLELEQTFEREFTIGQCWNSGSTYAEINANGAVNQLDTVNDVGACAGLDDAYGTADDCCPVNLPYCSPTTQKCDFSPNNVDGCGGFDNLDSCEGASSSFVIQDLQYNENPDCALDEIDCECRWDTTNGCVLAKTNTTQTNTIIIGEGPACVMPVCTYFSPESACIDGTRTFTEEVTLIRDTVDGCYVGQSNAQVAALIDCVADPETTVQCGQFSVELNFFGWMQFMIASVGVFGIYVLFAFRNSRKRE